MFVDRFAGQHTTASHEAIASFERAVWNVLAHRPQAAAAIADAIARSPEMTAAYALRGFCGVSLARRETIAAARGDLRRAQALVAHEGGSPGERALVEALALAVDGHLLAAADRLERHLGYRPHDLLAFKLAHGLRFMCGDAKGMLGASTAVRPKWSASLDGYGFVLGCHAFALEENGLYDEAEAAGRDAVAIEPFDAWGAHAVGHVHEMRGQPTLGVKWLEQTRAMWTGCNNFAFHMAWHLALHHLEQGRIDVVLELYDNQVRATTTDDFRDVANAVSMLWRLRQEQVDVGERWTELAEIARLRADDTTLGFASLHHLLALAAVGDADSIALLLNALARRAEAADGQGRAAAVTCVEFAHALVASRSNRAARLAEIATGLAPLGGSRAQRDVFLRSLVELADADAAIELLALRGKDCDRFERMTRARIGAARVSKRVA